VCASALHDKDELARSLHEFLEYEPRCADDVIRAANARLYASAVLGGLDLALDEALGVVDLSSECDPLVATSFLNALSRLLSLAARYKEGSDIADRAILLAEQAGLRFVRPHGLVARAVARIGLGAYSEANDATEEAAKLANEIHDRHNMVDACVVRARLALCEGEVEHAIRLTEESPRGVTSGLEAEFAATRALALACFGRSVESEEILHGLRHLSFLPDTAGLAMATRAVNAARAKDFASLMIQLRNIRDLGAIDALVIAQRASADLALAERRIDEPDLRELLSTRASLRTRAETPLDTLTPRQLEVLRLLQLGLTNREIAAKLVIEEATAKVHVRYVLRKLGVRSRTEAAILATRLGREAWEAGAPNPNSAG
jgi:DNA-binding CsgD family transcriptional regulator